MTVQRALQTVDSPQTHLMALRCASIMNAGKSMAKFRRSGDQSWRQRLKQNRWRNARPQISSAVTRWKEHRVYRSNGDSVGQIERVMIDKLSGKVAYAIMSFGGGRSEAGSSSASRGTG